MMKTALFLFCATLGAQTRIDPSQFKSIPAPTPASLMLSPATGVTAGATVSVNLTFKPVGTQPAGLQWSFLYNPSDLVSIGCAPGPVATAAGKSLSCAGSNGVFTCLATGINTNTIAAGVVAIVNLTLVSTVSSTGVGVANTMGATLGGDLYPVSGMGARMGP